MEKRVKLGVVMHAVTPSIWETGGGISVFQGQHKEFQDSLGYKDPVSKTETNKQKRERIKIVAHTE